MSNTVAPLTDAERERAEAALLGFDRLLRHVVNRTCRGLGPHDREDVLQNLRLHLVLVVLPRYDPARGPAYVARSARNFAIDACKAKGREPRTVDLDDVPERPGSDAVADAEVQRLADQIYRHPEWTLDGGSYSRETVRAGADFDLLAERLGSRRRASTARSITLSRVKKLLAEKIAV